MARGTVTSTVIVAVAASAVLVAVDMTTDHDHTGHPVDMDTGHLVDIYSHGPCPGRGPGLPAPSLYIVMDHAQAEGQAYLPHRYI